MGKLFLSSSTEFWYHGRTMAGRSGVVRSMLLIVYLFLLSSGLERPRGITLQRLNKIVNGFYDLRHFVFIKGRDCCSDSAISFHYVSSHQMYILDYLIYQLRPFGIQVDQRPAMPEAPPDFNLTAIPWFVLT